MRRFQMLVLSKEIIKIKRIKGEEIEKALSFVKHKESGSPNP